MVDAPGGSGSGVLPVALQIIGPPGHDAQVLAAAAAFEAAHSHARVLPRCCAHLLAHARDGDGSACGCGAGGCVSAAAAGADEEAAGRSDQTEAASQLDGVVVSSPFQAPSAQAAAPLAGRSSANSHIRLPRRPTLRCASNFMLDDHTRHYSFSAFAALASEGGGAAAGAAAGPPAMSAARLMSVQRSMQFVLSPAVSRTPNGRCLTLQQLASLSDPAGSMALVEDLWAETDEED